MQYPSESFSRFSIFACLAFLSWIVYRIFLGEVNWIAAKVSKQKGLPNASCLSSIIVLISYLFLLQCANEAMSVDNLSYAWIRPI